MPIDALSKKGSVQFLVGGCRGSSVVSGLAYHRHGGDTSCYIFESERHRLIIDAGTGLMRYARAEALPPKRTLLFLTHFHLDHLLGFPFFAASLPAGSDMEIAAVKRNEMSGTDALFSFFKPPFFPVSGADALEIRWTGHDLSASGSRQFGPFLLNWQDVSHPGGASAVRVDVGHTRIVLTSDVELADEGESFLRFLDGADIAILDAQYRPDEIQSRRGWGHSTPAEAATFAARAGVRRLYLTHHDPQRTDEAIDAMADRVRGLHPDVHTASDGLTLVLP